MICTSSLFNSKRPFKISEKPTLQGNSIHVKHIFETPKRPCTVHLKNLLKRKEQIIRNINCRDAKTMTNKRSNDSNRVEDKGKEKSSQSNTKK